MPNFEVRERKVQAVVHRTTRVVYSTHDDQAAASAARGPAGGEFVVLPQVLYDVVNSATGERYDTHEVQAEAEQCASDVAAWLSQAEREIAADQVAQAAREHEQGLR